MGLESYNGKKRLVVFKCRKCEEIGNDPMRVISEDDLKLVSGQGFVGVELPLCVCRSRSYLLPGEVLNGPKMHLRAVLYRKRYEAAGGDSNAELVSHRKTIDKLKKSYAEVASQEAQDQFDGKECVLAIGSKADGGKKTKDSVFKWRKEIKETKNDN